MAIVKPEGQWPALRITEGLGAGRPAGKSKVDSRTGRKERFKEPPASELARRYRVLEQAALFYMLPERSLRSLARRMRSQVVAAGEAIVNQSEPSTSMFFIESGQCQLRVETGPRTTVAVSLLSRGDFFGELSCLTERPAGETAIALDECRLLVLDHTALSTVVQEDGTFFSELERLGEQRAAGHAGVAAQLGWRRPAGASSVTAVYSPKGGSGRTTLALNVAGQLAKQYAGEVVLFDLSYPFAQAALLANLVPVSSMVRMAGAAPENAEEILLSAVLFHPAGLMILPGCVKPEEADLITSELVTRAFDILRRNFRHVIVDLGTAMTDPVLAVFDQADHVLLVVPPELPAIKSAQDAHAILTGVLKVAREDITLVRNTRTKRPSITDQALERRLGLPVAVAVGYDGAKPDKAALEGALLVLSDPGCEIARAARRISEILDASDAGEGER
jgi:MinD-like ATPase involved in chromosome partitioning or flagellar assembly